VNWRRRVLIAAGIIAAVSLLFGICSSQLLHGMKRSRARRAIADVVYIASAIESYRKAHGVLPDHVPVKVAVAYARVTLTRDSYRINLYTDWEFANGRWVRWPAYVPIEWIRESEARVKAVQVLFDRQIVPA